MSDFKIGEINIGKSFEPFIIAEMSGNHNQSLERALDIVSAAASTGVNALKIQTYTPDTMTLDLKDGDFFINDKKSLWYGKSLFELYKIAYTPWEWHEPIIAHARSLGLICFSTPFDESAVDFLEELNTPAYKIASFENNYLSLIKRVAMTGKPVIISTGMASLSGLDQIVKTIRSVGCENFVLLKCTSSYPANPKDSNINTIPHMRNLFNCEVGLSDHTMGLGASIAAIAKGASVIEKHFTLDRSDGGVDSEFSLEPEEMSRLVIESKRAWESLGKIHYGLSNKEKKSKIFKRSIYISSDMKKGEKFNKKNIRTIRPGFGLDPKYYNTILGREINQDVKKGQALSWSLIR